MTTNGAAVPTTTGSTEVARFTPPASVEEIRQRVEAMRDSVPDQLIVSTHSEAQHATALLKQVKGIAKDAERDRKAAKQPLLDEGRFIDSSFKDVTEPLGDAERVIKAGLLGYTREQERKEAERRQRELEAQQAAQRDREAIAMLTGEEQQPATEIETAPQPERRVTTITTGAGQSMVRKVWKVDITDIKVLCAAVASGEVAVQSVEGNATFLRAMLMGLPEDQRKDFTVPGVRFWQDDSLAVR
jgi:hypothetical protein